jgi:AcrR family transcriptional regulator
VTDLKGQAQRGARSREAIVDAALDVFAVRGYRKTALADIGAKVGLTPAAILYHFGTKEDLLLAVIAERDRRSAEVLSQVSAHTGLDALRAVVAVAELSERQRGLAALHTVLTVESFEPDAPAHEYFLGRSRFVRDWLTLSLLSAQREGHIAADIDCPARAREFVAFLEGAAVVWLLDPEVSLVSLYQTYIDSFIKTLCP